MSSNYWYIDLINNSLRLVYNGIPVTSVVTIKPYTIYNCTIVIANNGINITVNGNDKIKKMTMPDLITKTVKLGSDKNNQNNFTGKMGGIFLRTNLKMMRFAILLISASLNRPNALLYHMVVI